MELIWKDIKGYEGKYQVSNTGMVKRLTYTHTTKNRFGIMHRTVKEKILYLTVSRRYKNAVLWKYGTAKFIGVHRLVAMAFIRNTKNKPCVNHIDGNPSNNCVENLEWCTFSENELHSYRILGKKSRNKYTK